MGDTLQKACLSVIALGVTCIAIELVPISRQSAYWNRCLNSTIGWINEKPDLNKFQCIQLAYHAMESGGTSPAILNIANDLSVELFLNEKIEFNHIPKLIELCIANHDYIS